jgi:hypothetical protein
VGSAAVSIGQRFLMLQRATVPSTSGSHCWCQVRRDSCLSLEWSGHFRDILVVHYEDRDRQPPVLPQHCNFDPEEDTTILWNNGQFSLNNTASHLLTLQSHTCSVEELSWKLRLSREVVLYFGYWGWGGSLHHVTEHISNTSCPLCSAEHITIYQNQFNVTQLWHRPL